jgi:hypothetical protein
MKIKTVLPRRVKLGANFIIECKLDKPKGVGAPRRYHFSIKPIVPKGKKYRTYATRSFPGVVQADFVEVL